MSNHESVNEALALAVEGYRDAERAIEAARFVRIAELLKPQEAMPNTSVQTSRNVMMQAVTRYTKGTSKGV
jgi:hypothetical protein